MDAMLHALGGILLRAVPTFLLLIALTYYLKSVFFKPLEKVLHQRYEATEGAPRISRRPKSRWLRKPMLWRTGSRIPFCAGAPRHETPDMDSGAGIGGVIGGLFRTGSGAQRRAVRGGRRRGRPRRLEVGQLPGA